MTQYLSVQQSIPLDSIESLLEILSCNLFIDLVRISLGQSENFQRLSSLNWESIQISTLTCHFLQGLVDSRPNHSWFTLSSKISKLLFFFVRTTPYRSRSVPLDLSQFEFMELLGCWVTRVYIWLHFLYLRQQMSEVFQILSFSLWQEWHWLKFLLLEEVYFFLEWFYNLWIWVFWYQKPFRWDNLQCFWTWGLSSELFQQLRSQSHRPNWWGRDFNKV